MWFELYLLARGDAVADTLAELMRKGEPCPLHCFGFGVEGDHVRCVASDTDRESAIAAAELEHTLATEVAQAPKRG